MQFVGVDLHKHVIKLCVIEVVHGKREIVARRHFHCRDTEKTREFLALDMIPESHRPSPRIRQYRVLVRHRRWLSRRITSVKTKLRNKLAHYNADIAALFTRRGMKYMAELAVSSCDRFEMEALQVQLELFERQMHEVSV